MDALRQRLLNEFQRDFPLSPAPFAQMAASLGTTEAEVLQELAVLQETGAISRVGPVFAPNRIGVSLLAAMAVPPGCLECVASHISGYTEVNHNYEREHHYNLWFVVTAPSAAHLAAVLADIEAEMGLPVLRLPLEAEYHIDLGFDLGGLHGKPAVAPRGRSRRLDTAAGTVALDHTYRQLIGAVQGGLPLVSHPYAELGAPLGLDEAEVITRLERLLTAGIIRRLGVVVRHHELGYAANAMVVWDVPDDRVDAAAAAIVATGEASLCYRRPRQRPAWPYNLFCMLHGRERAEVLARVRGLEGLPEMVGVANDVLFSCRRFKQRGAQYVTAGG
jgi:DNA-binding Lrp family transcriptional regulator